MPNPWIILGTAGAWLASILLVGWLMYERGGDDNEAAHTKLALAETVQVLTDFVGAAKSMNDIATQFGGISADLSSQIGTISRNFRNGILKNPLPADCKPDAFRVQSLAGAIAAANSAAGRFTLPAVPPAK